MDSYIIYKNTKVFYSDQGRGSCVVLLHGFLENKTMWDELAPFIIKKNRVIAIDLLGHGKTGNIGYIHTMEDMAQCVYAVLKSLRLRRIQLVGHSMGGYVSLAFIDLYPKMVKGICLLNSTSKPDNTEKKKNRERAIRAVKKNYKAFVTLSVSNLFKPANRNIFTDEIKWVTFEALKTPLQGIVAALEGMKVRPDRENILTQAKLNKMLIIGKEDPVLDYKSSREEAKRAKLKLIGFPDGHMSHIENKNEVRNALLSFIKR
jgi:pimeloyl-ACP methyl ester carboxylesterase